MKQREIKFRYRIKILSEDRIVIYYKTLKEIEAGLTILNHIIYKILSRDECTGLKDKNGLTEIYEGDILKDDHNQIHEIKWVQKEGNLKALMLDKDWVDRYRHFKDIQFMEIIGNIYDDKRIN